MRKKHALTKVSFSKKIIYKEKCGKVTEQKFNKLLEIMYNTDFFQKHFFQ